MNLKLIKFNLKRKVYDWLGKTSLSRVQLNQWLKKIDIKTNRVLEVGASFNPVVKKVKSWKVKEYKTLDNNLERDCSPDFDVDLNHLEKDKKTVKNVARYSPNIIFCLEVMEYIYKPYEVLRFFNNILADGGILYISFHKIYPVHEPYKYDSLRYTKYGIINLLKDAGFTDWKITPRITTKGRESLASFYKQEKMHVLKKSNLPQDIGYLIIAKAGAKKSRTLSKTIL